MSQIPGMFFPPGKKQTPVGKNRDNEDWRTSFAIRMDLAPFTYEP